MLIRPHSFRKLGQQLIAQGLNVRCCAICRGFCGNHSACVLSPSDDAGGQCTGGAQSGRPAICPDHGDRSSQSRRTDELLANYTVQILEEHSAAAAAGPWFHAVGFIRPHVDWSAPQEFWDLYDPVSLPHDSKFG